MGSPYLITAAPFAISFKANLWPTGIWEISFVVSDLGGVRTMVQGHEKNQMSYEDAVVESLMAGCDFSDQEFMDYIPGNYSRLRDLPAALTE